MGEYGDFLELHIVFLWLNQVDRECTYDSHTLTLSSFRLGEACNHIAALLFALEDYGKSHNDVYSESVSSTSQPCEWNKPRKRKLSPKRIDEVRPIKHQYGKVPRMAAAPSTDLYKACPTLQESVFPKLLDDLRIVNPQCALFTAIEKHNTVSSDHDIISDLNVGATEELFCEDPSSFSLNKVPEQHAPEQETVNLNHEQPFHLGCISPFSALPPGSSEIKEKAIRVKRKLTFNENKIQLVEKKTRLQSQDSNWYLYRKGRITASKCKRVASLKPTTSPSKALKELLLCDRVPQTSAMLQGLESEDDTVDTFLSKMEMEGKHGFSFTKCGFFISKTHGFLGASPDRIIQDPKEDSPGVAELKFLEVKENETLADVLLRQHICVKRKEDNCTSLLLNKKKTQVLFSALPTNVCKGITLGNSYC